MFWDVKDLLDEEVGKVGKVLQVREVNGILELSGLAPKDTLDLQEHGATLDTVKFLSAVICRRTGWLPFAVCVNIFAHCIKLFGFQAARISINICMCICVYLYIICTWHTTNV